MIFQSYSNETTYAFKSMMKNYYREDHILVGVRYNDYRQYFIQEIFFNDVYKIPSKTHNVKFPFVFYTYDIFRVLKEKR